MTEERPIWRPNEIPPLEWERIPRADQIKWWKDREPSPGKKLPMKRAVQLFRRGVITLLEFSAWVIANAAEDEIEEFVQICPPDLMAALQETLARAPADGDAEGWASRIFIHTRVYAPWVTQEEIKESERRDHEQYWAGVKLLRARLGQSAH
jgi:hypothetical protein